MRKTTKMVAVLAAMSVMVLGAATMVSADEKNGWVKEGSDWYYYIKDVAQTDAWVQAGADWYYLGEDAKMETEEFVDGDDYYVDKDGKMVTGWLEIDNADYNSPTVGSDKSWYYFGASGKRYENQWVLSGSKWYFLESDGVMAENSFDLSGDYYLGDDAGAMITGWYRVTSDDKSALGLEKDDWIYAGTDGKVFQKDAWKKINGEWYYFGDVTQGAIGSMVIDGSPLKMVSKTFINDGTATFYLTKNGNMETGWFKADDEQYYASTKGEVAVNKVVKISGRYRYFAVDGIYYEGDDVWAAENASKVIVDTYADEADANAAAGVGGKIYKLGTGTVKNYVAPVAP